MNKEGLDKYTQWLWDKGYLKYMYDDGKQISSIYLSDSSHPNETPKVSENECRGNYCAHPNGTCSYLVGADYSDCYPCIYYKEQ